MKKKTRKDIPQPFPEREGTSPLFDLLDHAALVNKDTPYNDEDRGWRALIAMILLQAVSDACQCEDQDLAAEAREWLASKAAAVLFHFCQINYLSVKGWLEDQCPMPAIADLTHHMNKEEQLHPAEFGYLGVHWGILKDGFINDLDVPFESDENI